MPNCFLCGAPRRLVLQIYAPLDNSAFHRTLYIFACLNAPCNTASAAWLCIRVQMLEKLTEKETKVRHVEKIEWCTGADDWGEDSEVVQNSNEENGNVTICGSRVSDEEDESNSLGSDPLPGFNQLGIDDKNANAPGACAVERQSSPNKPSAEIEGGEAEVIMLDSPPIPQKDIYSLLNPSKAQVGNDVVLQSFFISVDEERCAEVATEEEHIRELMLDYESRDEVGRRTSPDEPGAAGGCDDTETYERGIPLHGDVIFHSFVQRIQQNPGQILRYSRDASPLLIAPLRESDKSAKCQNCGGETICELQILPTIISKLRLDNGEPATFDFGTVLISTCAKSCWDTPDKMRLEAVVVQQEDIPTR